METLYDWNLLNALILHATSYETSAALNSNFDTQLNATFLEFEVQVVDLYNSISILNLKLYVLEHRYSIPKEGYRLTRKCISQIFLYFKDTKPEH